MSLPNKILVLHNIRSVYNVGACFRTADAAGFDHIVLSGYTPTPLDRFNRPRKDLAKTALGAEQSVSWSHTTSLGRILDRYRRDDYHIVGVEQADRSVDYRQIKKSKNTVIIMGSETRGLSAAMQKRCDQIAEIPMLGDKNSLNVSVACGIILYSLL